MTSEWVCPKCGKVMPGPGILCSGSFLDEDHSSNVQPVQRGGEPIDELRDALEDAIRRAYTGMSDGRIPATTNLTLSPGRMRHLERIQRAAWNVVKERVDDQ